MMFFPILWMVLTAFKTELHAFSNPPELLFTPTLASFAEVMGRGNLFQYVANTSIAALGSTALGVLLSVPAAYVLAFYPTRGTEFAVIWMISTKMMPPVGVLVPIYLVYRNLHLLDNILGLLLIYLALNLPLIVWMLYTFFKEIPEGILEAARMDGASPAREIIDVLLPIARPGLASAALLAIIFSWNESFWSLNLTSAKAITLPVFVASFKTAEGLFWAKMSAGATLAILPVLVLGWIAQRQLARGLSFGAIK
jgi:sorbitol/mannitol transport system permease protein